VVRGFYTLGSGMLTQNRVLDTISNNIANINTPGFKKEKVTSSTFGEMVVSRLDSKRTPLSGVSMISSADASYTIFSEGQMKETGRPLDFAIKGQGFFAVQTDNGIFYTRNGSFNIDQEGYLTLAGKGRVMGQNGPVYLGTDSVESDGSGNLSVGGDYIDSLAVYDFDDYLGISAAGEGLFEGQNAFLLDNPEIAWETVEGSNIDASEQMSDAILAQRSLQSCSQVLKMYDQVLDKATSEIAKV